MTPRTGILLQTMAAISQAATVAITQGAGAMAQVAVAMAQGAITQAAEAPAAREVVTQEAGARRQAVETTQK